jgi:hypothetical protein
MHTSARFGGDELNQLLAAGAELGGHGPVRAAVHLLTFTELPYWRGFEKLLEIYHVGGPGGVRHAASVRDWRALADAPVAARLSGGDRHLLNVAVGLATGVPAAPAAVPGLGRAGQARRLAEAYAMAASRRGSFVRVTPPARPARLIRPRLARRATA